MLNTNVKESQLEAGINRDRFQNLKNWGKIGLHTLSWYTFIPWLVRAIKKERKSLPNFKLVGKALKNHQYLKAYETFWGTYNKAITLDTISQVYKNLGGNKRPVTSSSGALLYSGVFIHGINPFSFWKLLGEGLTRDNLNTIEAITLTYLTLGTPIILGKYRDCRKAKKKAKEKIQNLETNSIEEAIEKLGISKIRENNKRYNKFENLFNHYKETGKTRKLEAFLVREQPSYFNSVQLSYYR